MAEVPTEFRGEGVDGGGANVAQPAVGEVKARGTKALGTHRAQPHVPASGPLGTRIPRVPDGHFSD